MRDIEPAPPFSWTVEVHREFQPALEAWAALEACAPSTFYQTRGFAIPWHDTMGKAAGISPFIVILRDQFGDAAALFPFGIREYGGLRIAEFLGGKDSNANLGLFRPGFSITPEALRQALYDAATASGLAPDAYVLSNQPVTWEDFDNPLAALPHQLSPSYCHSALLMPDSEAFQKQQLSGDARKKLRYKRRKLEEVGKVSLLTARTTAEAQSLLDAFFIQKLERFDEKNISSGFDSPAARAFFARCCVSRMGKRETSVELHGLLAGDRIVATYGGGVHHNRFHGMFNSFDMTPEIARYSPGEILLSLLVESKCRQGLKVFDLGIGEGRYKSTWCDRAEPLFDTFLPLNAKGRLFVIVSAAKRQVKRIIKQNENLWSFVQASRKRLRLRSPSTK